jgi:hypothetical protein
MLSRDELASLSHHLAQQSMMAMMSFSNVTGQPPPQPQLSSLIQQQLPQQPAQQLQLQLPQSPPLPPPPQPQPQQSE